MTSKIEGKIHHLDNLFMKISEEVENRWLSQKVVVFLPYKASCWKSMESIWKAVDNEDTYESYVVPIPWCYREWNGTFTEEWQYEGDQFPSYVPITHYNSFDLRQKHPDIIFIQNPYDSHNPATSVHPLYYSSNIKQYTEKLIYIPWFLLNEIDIDNEQDGKAIYNMKYYALMPGVVHSDMIIVQSEKMRRSYIEKLTEFAGEDTRKIWERKIYGFGSPVREEIGSDKNYCSEIWLKIKEEIEKE